MLGWLKEIIYIFSYLGLVIASPFVDIPDGELDPAKSNIVLVYGLGGTPTVFLPMKEKLEEAGFNVLIADIGWARKDIEIHAKRLNKFLKSREEFLKKRYGMSLADLQDNILFFGHSMGGLIIIAAQRENHELLQFQVVAAGTSFHGTPLAYAIFWRKPGRQMFPDSIWLQGLARDMEKNPRKLYQIRAKSDELVPAYSSVLEGYPAYVAPFVGHAALFFELDPKIFKQFFPNYSGWQRRTEEEFIGLSPQETQSP